VFDDGRGTEEIAGKLKGFSDILRLAHARCKFVEVFKTTQSPFAREVMERLQAVYAIEAEIRGRSAEQWLAARTRTAPLMAALKARLNEVVGQVFSQSKVAEAINYALNHWDGLTPGMA
jgi:hypothetical protein